MTTTSTCRSAAYPVALALLLCAGCGKQQATQPAAPAATTTLPAAPQAERRHVPATHAPVAPRTQFVSADGRITNAVYAPYGSFEDWRGPGWAELEFDELAADCAAQPDNPDTWYRLGMSLYGDPSNQVACLEKAVRLAPDALRPRLVLAGTIAQSVNREDLPQSVSKEAAYTVLTAAYALVSSPAEMAAWVNAGRVLSGYGRTPSAASTALWSFVRERSGDSPLDSLAGLLLEEKDDGAVEGIGKLLASSGNEQYRAVLMPRLAGLKRSATNDPGVKQRVDALLEQYSTPYEKAMQKLWGLSSQERGRQGMALCREALELATNPQMRLSAVLNVVQDPALFRADPTNCCWMIEEAIGTEGWDSTYARSAIASLMRNGASDAVRAMVGKSLDASPSNPACVLAALTSMERFGGMYHEGREYVDLELLALARDRFPSNEAVIRALAGSYSQAECVEDERACRTLLMALAPEGRQRTADAVALLTLLVREKKLDEACQLAGQIDTLVGSNGPAALAVGACMLATGRTNDACALLMAACRNQQFAQAKMPVLQLLLTTRWPGLEDRQRILRFVIDEIGDPAGLTGYVRYSPRRSFSSMINLHDMLVRQLVDAGMYDEAFGCARASAQAGRYVSGLYDLARKPGGKERLDQCAREMLAGSCTQAAFFSSLAPACASAGLKQLSLELNVRALRCGIEQYQFIQCAGQALSLAHDLKDSALKNEAVALVDQKIRSGSIPIALLVNLRYQARHVEFEGKLDEWLDLAWQLCTNKTDPSAIQQMAQWYMERGMTGRLEQLVAPLALDSLQPSQALELLRVFRFIGDRETAKRLLDSARLSLTNSEAVARYGGEFLSMLREQMHSGDGSGKAEARSLVLAWLADPTIPSYSRYGLLTQAYDLIDRQTRTTLLERLLNEEGRGQFRNTIRSALIEAYVESGNTNGFVRLADEIRTRGAVPSWQLGQLVSQFERMNMPADAIVVCEQALEAQDTQPDQKAYMLMHEARLYLKMKENDQALRCVEDALAAVEDSGHASYMMQQAADLYLEAGKPQKGMDLLIQAFDKAASAQDACTLAQSIGYYAQRAEATFDPGSLISRLLSLERSVPTYSAAARILEQNGDPATAKGYMQQALGCAQTEEENRTVYESFARLAQACGDQDGQIQALEQLVVLADDDAKGYAMSQLAQTLIAAGDCTGAITRLGAFLAAGNGGADQRDNRDHLRRMLFEAQVTLGDKEAAWATAQTMQDWSAFLNAAQHLGRQADALPRLEQEFESGDPERRVRMASCLLSIYEQTKDQQAIAKLADAMATLAANASPRIVLDAASVLQHAGRADDALALLKKSSEKAEPGQQADSIDDRIVSLLRTLNRADDAIAWLDARPQSFVTLGLKAQIRAAQGRTDDAIELFCAAIEGVDDDNAYRKSTYAYELGAVLRQANNPGLADRVVERLLKGDAGNDPAMRQQAASLYQQVQRYDDAAAQFEKAARLVSDEHQKRQYIQQYAQCCVSGKKYEEAISAYNGLIKDDKLQWHERDQLCSSLASVYQQSGRESQAFDVYKESARDCESYIGKIRNKNEAVWARFRLAELHHLANNDNEAVRVLKKIADDCKTGPNALRAAQELKKYGY